MVKVILIISVNYYYLLRQATFPNQTCLVNQKKLRLWNTCSDPCQGKPKKREEGDGNLIFYWLVTAAYAGFDQQMCPTSKASKLPHHSDFRKKHCGGMMQAHRNRFEGP